jgi:hypothetical protein
VAGEISPLGGTNDVGAMEKKLQKVQNKENGLLPSRTSTRHPPGRIPTDEPVLTHRFAGSVRPRIAS